MTNMNEWWASLTVAQKERIASKAYSLNNPDKPAMTVRYPACSNWWISISKEEQQAIHDRSTDTLGHLLSIL